MQKNVTGSDSAPPVEVRCTILNAGFCRTLEWFVVPGGGCKIVEVPALFALIEHPDRGPILFDTGYSPRFMEGTRCFPHFVYRLFVSVKIAPHETAAAQLKSRGIPPEDVGWVIISHFDPDHCGGLRDFPSSRIVCSRSAWQWMQSNRGPLIGRLRILPNHLPENVAGRLYLLDEPEGPAIGGMMPTTDLFSDGSVQVVSLPGHAAGQIGALVQLSEGRRLLMVADACYSRRAIQRRDRWPISPHRLWAYDGKRENETYRHLRELRLHRPDITIVPSHCREAAAELLEEPLRKRFA